jgi:hypothetical protein
MFCSRTTRDEGVKFIFTTDGSFGLVAICNICIREADQILREEEAKNINFKPGGTRGSDPTERDR